MVLPFLIRVPVSTCEEDNGVADVLDVSDEVCVALIGPLLCRRAAELRTATSGLEVI
jgi:hypothetical protein